jgi:carbon monoxide dehydrogenase subunit G
VEIVRTLVAPCEPSDLFHFVDDLAAYEAWMPLIHDVEVDPEASTDDGPAWSVELRAQIGPFARSKRLRMVRAVHDPHRVAKFERAERDGRRHADWTLLAELEPGDGGTELTMTLRYGGSLWSGAVLQRVLDDQVDEGSRNLLDLVRSIP